MSNFGKLLERISGELGIPQAEIAKRIGISRQYLNMYANGMVSVKPSEALLDSLAKISGIDRDYVYACAGHITQEQRDKLVKVILKK